MKLPQLINKILAKFGIVLIRRASLEKLATSTANQLFLPTRDSLFEVEKILSVGLSSMESKIDRVRSELLQQQISVKWELLDRLEKLVTDQDNTETCPLCCHEGRKGEFLVFESQCIFGGGRLKRLQCPKCEVIFGAKKMFIMNPSELTQEYESHYKVFHEVDSTDQEIRAFHLLKPKKDGVYLNYGAGAWSKSVQVLRSQGWNVVAFEPHDSAVSDLDYLIKSKEDLQKLKFDGIFSNNVLEHLRYPVKDLAFMKKILKPGAMMSHATPCFEYLYEYTRFHLYFFLGRSRILLAEKAGLRVLDFVVDGEFMCVLFALDS
jgi:hypothetical protein